MASIEKILLLGAGLASTSFALALNAKQYKGRVLLFENQQQPTKDKTWCFWGRNDLPEYLRPLVCKRWHSWQFSDNSTGRKLVKQSVSDEYCCIRADDFWNFSHETLARNNNISQLYGKPTHIMAATQRRVTVKFGDQCYHGDIGFDSRPEKFSFSNGLYQCFTGAWAVFNKNLLNPDQAGLMLDLTSGKSGTEFLYILPFATDRALLTLTSFSSSMQDLAGMRSKTCDLIQRRYQQCHFTIEGWEQGILPMSTEIPTATVQTHPRWQRIGVAAGMIRAATGYAFLPIQRWCQLAANSIVAGKNDLPHHAISTTYRVLDKIFLKVLANQPELGAELFMNMAEKTTPGTFARFMTERATIPDLFRVVIAMPKLPFIKAIM